MDKKNVFGEYFISILGLGCFIWFVWGIIDIFYEPPLKHPQYLTCAIDNKEYLKKTTTNVDDLIINRFDEDVVIYNVNTNIVHEDFNCPAVKACTDNCVYMPKRIADNFIKLGKARGCNYELYTKLDCQEICLGTTAKLYEPCMNMCIIDLYDDKDFSLSKFYFNMAEQSVPDEDDIEDYHSNER